MRALTRREAVHEELDEEVRDYFERAGAELETERLAPHEAARAARKYLRDAAQAREDLRSYGWENVVEATAADLKVSVRKLFRAPGFAIVGVLTLALGIGASTAIYSAVVPTLFAPLPYPAADQLVMLSGRDQDGARMAVAYATYEELVARSRSFAELAVSDLWSPALAGLSEPERLDGQLVSADYFRALGVTPAIGRDFEPADDVFQGPRVAIISASLARRRFGAGNAVRGQPILLDGAAHTVIGVMPDRFANVLSPTVEVWAPRQFRSGAPFNSPEWGKHMRMIGRLAESASLDQARREISAISESPADEFPRPYWASLEEGLIVEPLQGAVTSTARPALFTMLGAVLLLLVIACANVTNLLLARSAIRRSELAVRAALGAGRSRLARQLFTESLLLSFLGGAAGLVVAAVGVGVIVALAPAGLPRVEAVRLDVWAFVFAFSVTAVVGFAVGLVPAMRGSRPDLRLDLHAQARATGGTHHRLRSALVVSELAVAFVLLAGAGLLLRSMERIFANEPGFDASGVLTMQIVTTASQPRSPDAALQYFNSVIQAVRRVPGVSDVALSSQLPLNGDFDAYGVRFESAPQTAQDETGVLRYAVTPEWFATMGIALRAGRLLDARDRPGSPGAVVISESLARRYFGEQDPIGQRVRFGPEIVHDLSWNVVVGVVGDVRQSSLAFTPSGAFYVAMGQWVWVDEVQSLVVRTRGDPAALFPSVKQAIWSVDRTPPVVRVATMEDLVAASESQRRFVLRVLGIFALSALVMAAVGLYGVIAGSVAERTREIGLRGALGASRRSILGLVARQVTTLTAFGVAVGLAAAAAVTRGLTSLLFGVTPLDPVTYAGVTVLLVGVAAAACSVPAWRAASVDPTIALRME
jgi:putative ABC transport system permease protein